MKTKTIKCKYCKGSGMVQIAQNSRGLKTCPYCNGKKQLKMNVNAKMKNCTNCKYSWSDEYEVKK